MLTNLLNKIKNLIKRGLITNVDKSTDIYSMQVKSYGVSRQASMLMPYGLVCDPLVNSECVTFSFGGDGSRMFGIPYNPSLIPSTKKGDVILFSNKTTKIVMGKDENILVKTNKDVTVECNNLTAKATTKASIESATIEGTCTTARLDATTVNVTATTINLTGNVNITGNLAVTGTSTLTGTTTIETKPFLTHTHSGVTSGADTSGGVV